MHRFATILALVALAAPGGAGLDPGKPGRFAVGSTTLSVVDAARNRTLVTEVWYPATEAGRDAPLRRGRHPLVLVAHGFCGSRLNYEYLTTWLAARGFVVAAPDLPGTSGDDCVGRIHGRTPDPEGDLRFLRTAFHASDGAAAPYRRAIRGERAGLVGHSLGTYAVIRATMDDPLLTPAVVLAPLGAAFTADQLAPERGRPLLVMASTADRLVAIDFVTRFFGLLPGPAVLVAITGGSHSGFDDEDRSLSADAIARQHALTQRYATAFLSRYLGRDRRFARFLRPADAAAQGGDVTLTTRVPAR